MSWDQESYNDQTTEREDELSGEVEELTNELASIKEDYRKATNKLQAKTLALEVLQKHILDTLYNYTEPEGDLSILENDLKQIIKEYEEWES